MARMNEGHDNVIEDNNKIAGSAKGGVSQRLDLATETNLSEEKTGRVSSAEASDKKDTVRGIVETFFYMEVHNTRKETAL